jgi:tryptophan-rich sensory protein
LTIRARHLAGLLVPDLAWTTIAALLNWQPVRLNGPFGNA